MALSAIFQEPTRLRHHGNLTQHGVLPEITEWRSGGFSNSLIWRWSAAGRHQFYIVICHSGGKLLLCDYPVSNQCLCMHTTQIFNPKWVWLVITAKWSGLLLPLKGFIFWSNIRSLVLPGTFWTAQTLKTAPLRQVKQQVITDLQQLL